MRTAPLLIGIALLVGPGRLPAQSPESADRVVDQISAHWLAPHVRFLASPLLEGRETGTRGARLAAEYVAAELAALGLAPLGSDGSYLQRVPLRHSRVEGTPSLRVTGSRGSRELQWGTEYLIQPDVRKTETSIPATPMVFVGFGLTLPEHNHDDYAGVDVPGKLVVVLPGGPERIPSDRLGHATMLHAKEANARAHGAAGMVTIFPMAPERLQDRFMRQLSGFSWLTREGEPRLLYFEENATVRLSTAGATALFELAGQSLTEVLAQVQQGSSRSFELPLSLSLSVRFSQTDTAASNVVGLLRGSDPLLWEEYLVYTAHLDHVGIGRPLDGDSINYGALDNAGGTATLLAMARAFTSLPTPPRRSVLFVAVTAEEKGILGSHYFVHHPPVDVGRIVANVNMDNYLMLYPVRDLAAYGAAYSTLDTVVRGSLQRLGVALSEDAAPEQTIFTRSDHYPFMRHGIPAVMLFNGRASGGDGKDGSTVLRQWLAGVHHSPRDRMDQGIDWNAGVTYARANFLIGYSIANQPEKPRWRGRYFFMDP